MQDKLHFWRIYFIVNHLIAMAKAKGKHLGRPRMDLNTLSKDQKLALHKFFVTWKAKEITTVEFMRMLSLKTNTFYKITKEYERKLG